MALTITCPHCGGLHFSEKEIPITAKLTCRMCSKTFTLAPTPPPEPAMTMAMVEAFSTQFSHHQSPDPLMVELVAEIKQLRESVEASKELIPKKVNYYFDWARWVMLSAVGFFLCIFASGAPEIPDAFRPMTIMCAITAWMTTAIASKPDLWLPNKITHNW